MFLVRAPDGEAVQRSTGFQIREQAEAHIALLAERFGRAVLGEGDAARIEDQGAACLVMGDHAGDNG